MKHVSLEYNFIIDKLQTVLMTMRIKHAYFLNLPQTSVPSTFRNDEYSIVCLSTQKTTVNLIIKL